MLLTSAFFKEAAADEEIELVVLDKDDVILDKSTFLVAEETAEVSLETLIEDAADETAFAILDIVNNKKHTFKKCK